jgi:hypothetical protein
VNTYRAVITGGHGGRADSGPRNVSWAEARDALMAFADTSPDGDYPPDGCDHCYAAATKCRQELAALGEGESWQGDIDWFELSLRPEEAETGHAIVDWRNATARFGR